MSPGANSNVTGGPSFLSVSEALADWLLTTMTLTAPPTNSNTTKDNQTDLRRQKGADFRDWLSTFIANISF
jgi:hypothetical protein